jgi:TPR repeat protein
MEAAATTRLPLTEAHLERYFELAQQRYTAKVIEGLLPYWRNPDAFWLMANALYDDPTFRHRALRWLLRAQRGRHPRDPMTLKIADCYASGHGTPVNLLRAYEWLLIPARAGSPEAMFKLGLLELAGLSVPVNHLRAAMWFNLTAAISEDPELLDRAQAQREALVPHVSWEEAIKSVDMGLQWLATCSW